MNTIASPEDMLSAGAAFVARCQPGDVVFLEGDLGVGKTTFVRGCLRALGCEEPVKSPTYNIVHTYDCPHWQVVHFDLYRLKSTEELDEMGFDAYFTADALVFIEWPALLEQYRSPFQSSHLHRLTLVDSKDGVRDIQYA